MPDDVSGLTQLGSKETKYEYIKPSPSILETFRNQFPENNFLVRLVFSEWSSLCPRTGQPDFGTITIEYVPDQKCVESKSLKLYFFAFRNEGTFMETVTNRILNDFVGACSPIFCKVTGSFKSRGGIVIEVEAEYSKDIDEDTEVSTQTTDGR